MKSFEVLQWHAIEMEETNREYLCFLFYLSAADIVNSNWLILWVIYSLQKANQVLDMLKNFSPIFHF